MKIEANSTSYTANSIITAKGNRRYDIGVKFITTALVISIILILANKFIIIEKAPTKVQVVNVGKIVAK